MLDQLKPFQEITLLRGLMSGSPHWHDFLHYLKNQLPQYKVHTPDIIGNGTFCNHKTPTCPQKNIEALRHQHPSRSKKIIIGFSLGGMLAVEWARLYPNEVGAIVLINSSFKESPHHHRFQPRSFFKIISQAFAASFYQKEKNILRLTTSLSEETIHKVAVLFEKIEQSYPTISLNFIRQLQLARRISLQTEKPNIPILLLVSKNDRIVSPQCSELISKKWGLDLIYHPNAGHDLTLDDPEWVTRQITTWLDQLIQKRDSNRQTDEQPLTL